MSASPNLTNDGEFIPVTPAQLTAILRAHAEAGESVGILGSPGCGKSEIVASVAAMVSKPMPFPINLALMDATDLKGIPQFLDGGTSVYWAKPKDLMQFAQVPLTCFCDEFPQAAQATMASAATIILEKRVDDLYFHPDTWVVWAGNRSTDRAASNRVPSHVLNRSYLYELVPCVEEWSRFELNQPTPTDHLTVRFVRMKGDELFEFDPARQVNGTPRAWSTIARHLAKNPGAPVQTIAGRIGKGYAVELMAFRDMAASLPSREEIMLNPEGAPVPNKPSALFLVGDMLADYATPTNFDSIATYAKRMPREFQAKLVQSAVKRDRNLCNTNAFTSWGLQFADSLM